MSVISQTFSGGQPPEFLPITPLDCQMMIDDEQSRKNIRHSLSLNLPEFTELPECGKIKFEPLALIAGGPTLKKTIKTAKQFRKIMVCGSAHDHAVAHGIRPTYAVINDPMEDMIDYVKNPQVDCLYLIVSHCHPNLFKRLKNNRVAIWHDLAAVKDTRIFGGRKAIIGGCTAILRGSLLGIHLGYREQHFFGMDSSFPSWDNHHVYDSDAQEIHNQIIVKVGNREFRTTDGWVAQAQQFQDQLTQFSHLLFPFVHGDSMMAEIIRQRNKMIQEAA